MILSSHDSVFVPQPFVPFAPFCSKPSEESRRVLRFNSLSVPSVVQQPKIMQFQQDFNHKKRKEHRDKNLWRFFFAIFVFFAVNSFLVAACRAGPSVVKQ
jgi:hypothetical protein